MKVVNRVEAVVGRLDLKDSDCLGLLVGGREHLSYVGRWLIGGVEAVDRSGSLLESCSLYPPRRPLFHRVHILNSLGLGDTVDPLKCSCTCGPGDSDGQR